MPVSKTKNVNRTKNVVGRATNRKNAPQCVRTPPDQSGPACPGCDGETFWFEDEDGKQLMCWNCSVYATKGD
ncbi:MAG: hypothetical protein K8U57_03525 [Planctomycetes bacterium]|nr:hypothetical protein [Planctomycetota bacterium]